MTLVRMREAVCSSKIASLSRCFSSDAADSFACVMMLLDLVAVVFAEQLAELAEDLLVGVDHPLELVLQHAHLAARGVGALSARSASLTRRSISSCDRPPAGLICTPCDWPVA